MDKYPAASVTEATRAFYEFGGNHSTSPDLFGEAHCPPFGIGIFHYYSKGIDYVNIDGFVKSPPSVRNGHGPSDKLNKPNKPNKRDEPDRLDKLDE